eukprot:6360094-Amphidinium_carterae.1
MMLTADARLSVYRLGKRYVPKNRDSIRPARTLVQCVVWEVAQEVRKLPSSTSERSTKVRLLSASKAISAHDEKSDTVSI